MCQKAKEIQRQWKQSIGDNLAVESDAGTLVPVVISKVSYYNYNKLIQKDGHLRPEHLYEDDSRISDEFMARVSGISWSIGMSSYYNVKTAWYDKRDNCVWLPRQDQLQDMVLGIKNSWNKPNYLTIELREFIDKQIDGDIMDYTIEIKYSYDTMEQLWLAFVMYENYNKKWINNKWQNM